MEWYYVVLLILIVILLKFIVNLYKYFRTKHLYKKYREYLGSNDIEFAQYKEEIKTLFKDAGLRDSTVMHQEFLGYGNFANMQVSLFANLTNCRTDIVANVEMRFTEAIGVYRRRYIESFNPIFWIDFIVKLPQYVLQYMGVVPEKAIVKIVLLIYWVCVIILGLARLDVFEALFK